MITTRKANGVNPGLWDEVAANAIIEGQWYYVCSVRACCFALCVERKKDRTRLLGNAVPTFWKDIRGPITEQEINAVERRDEFKHAIAAYLQEYINEAEHQDGLEYWNNFTLTDDATKDFGLFIANYDHGDKAQQ